MVALRHPLQVFGTLCNHLAGCQFLDLGNTRCSSSYASGAIRNHQILTVRRKADSRKVRTMQHIAQHIVALAVFPKRDNTVLVRLHLHLQRIVLSGFRQVFDDNRMRSRFQFQRRAVLLLAVHKQLIILYTFNLQSRLRISRILKRKANQMKRISFVYIRQYLTLKSHSRFQLVQRQRRIQQGLHGKCFGIDIHTIHQIRLLHHERSRITERFHVNVFSRSQQSHTQGSCQDYLFFHKSIKIYSPQR